MNEVLCEWSSPPSVLTLLKNEIHVWHTPLDVPAYRIQELGKLLSSDEQERAEKFYFERHRRRFTVARGLLRTILGRYLNADPKRLHFIYSSRGKPELAPDIKRGNLNFNISHSHESAIYVVAYDRLVGIDIEHIRSNRDIEQLAQRFFLPGESAFIGSLPPERRLEAFYSGWVRKEAYLKATGVGLAGLEDVEVSISPEEPAKIIRVRGDVHVASRWSMYDLAIPKPGYASALVAEGLNGCLHFYCAN